MEMPLAKSPELETLDNLCIEAGRIRDMLREGDIADDRRKELLEKMDTLKRQINDQARKALFF